MKKLLTLILLFTITLFLSANQIVIANDYNFIISNQEGFDFTDGTLLNDAKYQRTNKIAITNDTIIADRLKYHYVFFWNEADAFLGYYKTSKAPITSGTYLGQVNTQNIPLPLNAYSFALVRYDNDYVLVGNYTVKDLFIDNNLTYDALPDFNEIPIAELNGLTLNEVFDRNILLDVIALPNGVKYYEISGGNIVQRVQERELLFNDVDIVQSVSGIIQARVLNGIVINGTNNTIDGKSILNGYIETATRNLIAPFDKYMHAETAFGILNALYVAFPSGTTLAQAQTALAGTELLYQLATPITITSGVSINQAALDFYYQAYLNPINFIYYKHADTPTGEVSSVNNYYYAAGKNLFDKDDLIILQNTFLAGNGIDTGASALSNVSYFINVKSSTVYYIANWSDSFSRSIGLYDNNQNVINVFTSTGDRTITTTSNTHFIRFGFEILLENSLQLEENGTPTLFEPYAPPDNLLNLTLLFGVDNEPDLATMDTYYDAYDEYLDYTHILPLAFTSISIQFQTIFFNDGVSEQIETLGLILTFTLIAFTLMIFGFISNRRIFNLLSIGAFVVLGVFLIEFIGFIIILFGLIFINVYYTFFGEL